MKLDLLRLKYPTVFTTKEANKLGVSPQLLRHYMHKGFVEKVSHGVYRFAGSSALDLESQILEVLKVIPQGIVSHQTALRIYGLSEHAHPHIDLIVPDSNIPKRKLEDVKLHPMSHKLTRFGINKVRNIRITSLERTLIDLLRSGEAMSFLISIYREAQMKKVRLSLPELRRFGRKLHAKAKTKNFLEALL